MKEIIGVFPGQTPALIISPGDHAGSHSDLTCCLQIAHLIPYIEHGSGANPELPDQRLQAPGLTT